MSTSLLYHTFGIRSVQHLCTDFFDGKTVFRGSLHPSEMLCPACRSRHVIQYGHTRRVFKTLPVGHKKVELAVDIPLLFCKDCGAIRQANLEFADPKKHYTH